MTKDKCQKLILDKLVEIEKIYKKFNPKANYLNLSILDNSLSFNNVDDDEKTRISVYYTTNNKEVYDMEKGEIYARNK